MRETLLSKCRLLAVEPIYFQAVHELILVPTNCEVEDVLLSKHKLGKRYTAKNGGMLQIFKVVDDEAYMIGSCCKCIEVSADRTFVLFHDKIEGFEIFYRDFEAYDEEEERHYQYKSISSNDMYRKYGYMTQLEGKSIPDTFHYYTLAQMGKHFVMIRVVKHTGAVVKQMLLDRYGNYHEVDEVKNGRVVF